VTFYAVSGLGKILLGKASFECLSVFMCFVFLPNLLINPLHDILCSQWVRKNYNSIIFKQLRQGSFSTFAAHLSYKNTEAKSSLI
jgi:hypothetical protein